MGRKGAIKGEIRNFLLQSRLTWVGSQCASSSCLSSVDFRQICRTVSYVIAFYVCSISLTFYNQRFIHQFRFPLSITMTHLFTKFVLAAFIRWIWFCKSGQERVILPWGEYFKRVAPPGFAASLDIGLSNWSFEFITISLYTMTKTSVVVFILFFSLVFRLEKPRCCLIFVVIFIAVGLLLFTFELTQFHALGFSLVLTASFLSGLRWTLSQMVLQKKEAGLSNPLDMMFHIQPWMILALLPLSAGFEGLSLSTSKYAFAFRDSDLLAIHLLILFAGAFLAFMLEFTEFLLVSHTSSLTLSVAGIFKEVLTLSLATIIYGDRLNAINVIGLITCIAGITLHVILKAVYRNDEETKSLPDPSAQSLLDAINLSEDNSDVEVNMTNQSRQKS